MIQDVNLVELIQIFHFFVWESLKQYKRPVAAITTTKYKKMKEIVLNGKFELIEVAGQPLSLISLPNGNLVCYMDNLVKLLDENLKEIKSVSTGGESFCALNKRNEIYVSVYQNHCIIK